MLSTVLSVLRTNQILVQAKNCGSKGGHAALRGKWRERTRNESSKTRDCCGREKKGVVSPLVVT